MELIAMILFQINILKKETEMMYTRASGKVLYNLFIWNVKHITILHVIDGPCPGKRELNASP